MVPVQTCQGGVRDSMDFDCEVSQADSEKYYLEESIEKSWERDQERRRQKGLPSPDWIVPKVKLAKLTAVTQILSLYSY
jgi:hypothetical protein